MLTPALRFGLFIGLLLFVYYGCDTQPHAKSKDTAADTVWQNGRIYTVNPSNPWAEALAIKDGTIIFTGSNGDAKGFIGAQTTVEDLRGRMVMPGIHDVHMHPLEAMSPLGICHLDEEESDAERFIPILSTCQHDRPDGVEWVFGFGHSIFTMLDAQRMPVDILDEAIPDRPAIVMEATSHSLWVNSHALSQAGIDANSPDPQGGVVFRDSDTGAPSGVVMDAAGDLLLDAFWTSAPEIQALNYDGLLQALDILSENGITSICEARTYWRRAFHEAWLRAETEDQLTVRAVLCLWAYPHLDDAEQLAALKELYRSDTSRLLRIDQIKLYSDGIIPNTTAAMHEPYALDLEVIDQNKGLNYFTAERMAHYIEELERHGFDFHVHAVGDRGIHETLNAIEAARDGNGDIGARHRITHLEVVDPADYSRFRALNVTADCQVAGAFTQPENWIENVPFIGDRSEHFVPLKDLHEAQARITLSSDWDVSTVNPFVGMQNALTRSPQNLPDLKSVIEAYTINAAYVMRQEDRVGSIVVGKRADLIVLDRNLFEIPVDEIGQARVLVTMLDGEEIYRR